MIEKSNNPFVFDALIDNFESNYDHIREMVSKGYTKRIDMPVIAMDQINGLQSHLENGMLDVVDAKTGKFHKAFPQGLKGEQAAEWLHQGLKDGVDGDDMINVSLERLKADTLTPIQEQIYFDVVASKLVEYGIDSSIDFLQNVSFLIVSKDGYIMDGHHRWVIAMLIDPELEMQAMVIDVEKDKLLVMLNTFSDAIGNERNK